MDELYGFIRRIGDIGVLILGEVWINSEEVPFFNIPNYEKIFNCRDENQGGGTAIYVRKNIKFKVLETSSTFNKIILELTMVNKKFKIMTMYRPPRANFDDFLCELERDCDKYKNMIIVGDMNINLLQDTPTCTNYKTMLDSYYYRILNTVCENSPTRSTATSCSIIDHVISDVPSRHFSKTISLLETCISDHKALVFDFKVSISKKSEMTTKEFKRMNNSKYTQLVRTFINSIENPSIDDLIEILKQAKDSSTTFIKKRVRSEAHKWMTLEIVNLMEKRDRVYKQMKRNPNNVNLKQNLEVLSSKIQIKITEAKSSNLQEKLNDANDLRKLWAVINEEIGIKTSKSKHPIDDIFDGNGNKISEKSRIADTLNEYFLKYAKTLRANVNVQRLKNPKNNRTIFLRPTTSDEVYNEILKLKLDCSPGADNITSHDLKEVADIIAPILVQIFNEHLALGTFPNCLKITEIVPIYKDGDRDQCNSYRPISLLPTIGKVFEKLINKRLLDFLESDEATKIDPNQFGFQQKSSTDAALSKVLCSLNKYLDDGEYVAILFVDLRKAFDLVDHATLLEVLDELGVRGIALNLFKSYLENRTVNTKIGNTRSSQLTLEDGVPQGSVLGPTLYLLYINSLRYLGTQGERTIYADDTCYVYHAKNKDHLEDQIKQDMGQYFNWLHGQKLVINIKKTNYIVFKPKRKAEIQLNLGEPLKDIERVTHTKYLGVYLDEHLSWTTHVDNLRKKIYPLIGAIRRCPLFPQHIRQQIYNAHIISRIRSSLTIWSLCNKENLDKIQKLMNRALKALYNLDWYTTLDDLLEITDSFSLEELIKIERCKFIFRVQHDNIKNNITLIRHEERHRYPTSSRRNFVTNASKTNNMKKGILNLSITEFNKLPLSIKNSSNFIIFSQEIKKHFKNIRD